ncbi:hypothetical protein [Arthrobacter sp. USHLN218]|uniref:hypothetical protein n=1 Tax=Arthrobacter sp. USHLN218 TaxID=3081232 RepID=UPI0030192D98
MSYTAPAKVVPGEQYSIVVTVTEETTWIGSFSSSVPIGGLPATLLNSNDLPVLNRDGTWTKTFKYIASDAPYGEYSGHQIWVSDRNGNGITYDLDRITLHDPAHPIDARPAIGGYPGVGSTLTASINAGAGAVTTFIWTSKYHFPGSSYRVSELDLGRYVTVFSTTVFPDGTRRHRTAFSSTIGLGVLAPPAPTLAAPAVGKAVAAGHLHGSDQWVPVGTVTTSVQWFLNGNAVPGATNNSFTPQPADVGKKLRFRVTTSTDSAYYKQTPILQDSPERIVAAATLTAPRPAIRSAAKNDMYPYIGVKLNADAGTWTKGAFLSYQWTRDGKPIKGATRASYAPVPADHKKRIGVTVTGRKPGHTTRSVSSTIVRPSLRTLSVQRIDTSGRHETGHTVKVVRAEGGGSWTTGTKVSYQWYRNGKPIKGATKSSYKIQKADRRTTLTVRATGTKYGYATASSSRSVRLIWG